MQNMGALLQQAQMMQKKKCKEVDTKLKMMEVEGLVSQGMVKVTMNGKGEIKNIKIDPTLKEDVEILEDLIMAAISEAKKADHLSESEMKSVTGGMPLPPGMKF